MIERTRHPAHHFCAHLSTHPSLVSRVAARAQAGTGSAQPPCFHGLPVGAVTQKGVGKPNYNGFTGKGDVPASAEMER